MSYFYGGRVIVISSYRQKNSVCNVSKYLHQVAINFEEEICVKLDSNLLISTC